MHRFLLLSLFGLAILAPFRTAVWAEDDLSGFTLQQLNTAIVKGGAPASQKIYSILSFDSDDRSGANIAILGGSHSGWRVVVLHRIKGGLDAEWRSGKLSDDFAVSSSHNLKIEYMDDGEQVVEFSGCAAHDCGGLDGGIFGVLLYSPRSKQVFFAHYRYGEGKPRDSFGSVWFSENSDRTGNEKYKAKLRKALSRILHYDVP